MKEILPSDYIGDSLPTINLNFKELDTTTYNIWLSAYTKLQPLVDYLIDNKTLYDSALTTYRANIAKWTAYTTFVSENSSKCLTHLNITYPTVILDPLSKNNYDSIIEWFNTNYPVISNDTLYYLDTQKAVVNIFTYTVSNQIAESRYLYDATTCQTNNGILTVTCTDTYSGQVACPAGVGSSDDWTMDCNYTKSCTKSQYVQCYFTNPNGTNTKTITRSIAARINMNFNNRYEKSIKMLFLKVSNCRWVLDKLL